VVLLCYGLDQHIYVSHVPKNFIALEKLTNTMESDSLNLVEHVIDFIGEHGFPWFAEVPAGLCMSL
jgi:hypothetical protein